ncbi:MAG: LacI family DNA-binding transcriptional regulator [Solirubrobacterales bacterium]|nr:LacI family DNA-binding transcriptional regulator [Solirubrobacterales bacterium]
MAATIREVAQAANVSQATAARALGQYGYVSDDARERVARAAKKLGYVPNSVARALASGATNAIGLVVGDIENPFFAAAARGMSDQIEAHGHSVLLANSDEDLERERIAVETLLARRVDGLVVVPSSEESEQHLDLAARSGALVLLDREVDGLAVDSVTADNVGGARAATEHLISHGHTRIGFVSDSLEISSSSLRLHGYREALEASGIDFDESLVSIGGPTAEDGYQAALKLLERGQRPTALFTANNFMTLGAMHALRFLDLSVPGAVALVGFDDLEWTTLVDPPVTVISQPAAEIGREAARLLIARIEGEDGPPQRVRLDTELIIRLSCGCSNDCGEPKPIVKMEEVS